MKTTVRLSIFCLLSMLGWGCNLINPTEELPAILIIDEFSFSTTYNTEYSASENISEVWVFANDQVIGAFDLPAEVPVLGEGVTQIKVYPGIKVNGIGSTRDIYPFYEVYIENIDLQPLKVDTIRPVFQYVDNAVIISVDDFETSNAFVIDNSSEGSVIRTTDPEVVFEGDGSGHLKLTAEENLVRVTTNEQQYELPTNRLIYLEMDYRCDNSMAMGLFANTEFDSEKRYIVVLNPTVNDDGSEYWNKVYVAIDPTVALTSTFDTYEVFFESSRDQDNDSEINVYIDNVKLVYFP
ncbi:MAG: hypothetical protein P8H59_05150 [Flavobacteriales bacterium]|nr:hypothetical protein [Flavobacteriales bacterium]